MPSILTALLSNPACVAAFRTHSSMLLADPKAVELAKVNHLKFQTVEDVQDLVHQEALRQLKDSDRFRPLKGIPKGPSSSLSNPKNTVEQLAFSIIEVHRLLGAIISREEHELAIQDCLQLAHGLRKSFSKQDWENIANRLYNPYQTHLLRFIRERDALSPQHWYRFCDDPTVIRPENPTLQMRVGEIRLPGRNFALQIPIQTMLLPGLWVYFNGASISLTSMRENLLEIDGVFAKQGEERTIGSSEQVLIHQDNSIIEAQIDIRSIWYELPLLAWNTFSWMQDDHPHKIFPGDPQLERPGKYVVVRNSRQEYSARCGATHHFEMIGPDDILIAGGWIGVPPKGMFPSGRLLLDANTSRFGHLMKDHFFTLRLMIASEVIRRLSQRSVGFVSTRTARAADFR